MLLLQLLRQHPALQFGGFLAEAVPFPLGLLQGRLLLFGDGQLLPHGLVEALHLRFGQAPALLGFGQFGFQPFLLQAGFLQLGSHRMGPGGGIGFEVAPETPLLLQFLTQGVDFAAGGSDQALGLGGEGLDRLGEGGGHRRQWG